MSDPAAPAAVRSALSWFEIPVADLARARRFYETILGTTLREEVFGGADLAVFPYGEGGTGGCLYAGAPVSPGEAGTVVYLNAGGRLDAALASVEAAGGRIALPKTALPPGMGWFAHIVDSEGNRVGLHSTS